MDDVKTVTAGEFISRRLREQIDRGEIVVTWDNDTDTKVLDIVESTANSWLVYCKSETFKTPDTYHAFRNDRFTVHPVTPPAADAKPAEGVVYIDADTRRKNKLISQYERMARSGGFDEPRELAERDIEIEGLRSENAALRQQVAAYRAALEYYADRNIYLTEWNSKGDDSWVDAVMDSGEKAREALQAATGGGEGQT